MSLDPTTTERNRLKGLWDSNFPVTGSLFTGNIPTEKTRVTSSAASFISNPWADKFTPAWPTNAAITKRGDTNTDWGTQLVKAMAAVYKDYINSTELSKAGIRAIFLTNTSTQKGHLYESKLDFTNTVMFSTASGTYGGDANPFFSIAQGMKRAFRLWLKVKWMGWFTAQEIIDIELWFKAALTYFKANVRQYYAQRFAGGIDGNHTLTSYSTGAETSNPKEFMFYDHVTGTMSPQVGFLGRGFNNRILTECRFICELSYYFQDQDGISLIKRWFDGQMKFGVYVHNGFCCFADEHRSTKEPVAQPIRGFKYAVGMADGLSEMAEVGFAYGDKYFYDYTTTAGVYGSSSTAPKTLKGLWLNIFAYVNGTHNRYSSNTIINPASFVNQKITSVDKGSAYPGDYSFQFWACRCAAFYNDSAFNTAYRQRPFPTKLENVGPNDPRGGNAGTDESMLLNYEGRTIFVAPVKIPQEISFSGLPTNVVFGVAPLSFSVSSDSGLTISRSLTGFGQFSGNTLIITGAGDIVLKFNQAGNDTYLPAPEYKVTIKVAKAAQTLTFASIADKAANAANFTVTPTLSSGLTPETESKTPTTLTEVSTNTYDPIAEGTASIRAFHPGDANYLPVEETRTFLIKPVVPTIVNIATGKTWVRTYFNQTDPNGNKYTVYRLTCALTPGVNYALTKIQDFKNGNRIYTNRIKNVKFQHGPNLNEWTTIFADSANTALNITKVSSASVTGYFRIEWIGAAFSQVDDITNPVVLYGSIT